MTSNIVPAQDYNVLAGFEIAAFCGFDCFDVYVLGHSDRFQNESTDNSMNPTGPNSRMQIGTELAGPNSDGASSGHANYTMNQWYGSNWNFQSNDGVNIFEFAPPYIDILDHPHGSSNNGGTYQTFCCTTTSIVSGPRIDKPSVPSRASPSYAVGIPALTQGIQQPNGARFDNQVVASYVLHHKLPRTVQQGSGLPTGIQKIVYAKSQDISEMLHGESLGVPAGTLLCYVQVSGTFAFPSPPGTKDVIYNQGVEVFDATTGNLLLAGG